MVLNFREEDYVENAIVDSLVLPTKVQTRLL